ncbi:MAG: RHS repeat domain-containing protein, partial [Planctomycetota bacterium]|jgi:RHS repeat-associated protein
VVKFTYSPAKGSDSLYGNDPVGVVSAATDGRGNTSSYKYDALYRLTRITDPLGNKTVLTYDDAGRVIQRKQANKKKINYNYNKAGQLVTKILSTGEEYTYKYDKTTGILESASSFPFGHMLEASLDKYERVSQTVTTFPSVPNPFKVTLDYDYREYGDYESSVLMSVGPNNDRKIGYTFESWLNLGPLATEHWSAYYYLYYAFDSAYRCTGWLESYTLTEAKFLYDDADRLTKKSFENGYKPGTILFEMSWKYGPSGVLEEMTDPDGTHKYFYDNAGRLTKATHPPASTIPKEEFSYDKAGNRYIKGSEAAFIFDEANQLIIDTTCAYGYDESGNCVLKLDFVAMEETYYIYDAENRLTEVIFSSGDAIQFIYDPVGRLIERRKGTDVLRFVHDGDEILGVFDGSDNFIRNYINGSRMDMMEGYQVGDLSNPPTNYYYYTDPIGTPRAVANEDGSVSQNLRYEVFGKPVGTASNTRLFAGLQYDKDCGLYYVRNRFYDPNSGRFMQRDPVPMLAAIAPYVYAGNAPTMVRDPYGLEPESELGGLADLVKSKVVDPNIDKQISDNLSNAPTPDAIFGPSTSTNYYSKWDNAKNLGRALWDAAAIRGAAAAAWFDQVSAYSDVFKIWGSKCPLEAGIDYYKKMPLNPAGKYVESVLTMGGQLPRRTATIKKVDGLRSGLRSWLGF